MSAVVSALFGFIALVALFTSGVLLLALRLAYVAGDPGPTPVQTAVQH